MKRLRLLGGIVFVVSLLWSIGFIVSTPKAEAATLYVVAGTDGIDENDQCQLSEAIQNTNTYTTLSTVAQSQTSLTQTTINNQPVLKLAYQLQDGGLLDQDNTANGTIVDPVGLAQASVGVPNTGL